MKIAFFVIRFPLLSETFILNQITGLIERGHEVDIYSGKPGDTSKMHPDVEKYELLSRTYYAITPNFSINYVWQGLQGLIKLLNQKHYDIIHCQFGELGRYAVKLRHFGLVNGKLVTSFRGHDISRHLQQYGDNFYNQLFEKGDLFMPNCDFFKGRLLKIGCDEQKIVVHRSGLDCNRFTFVPRRPRPDGRVKIVTVGRLVEKKGIEYSIRAVAKLAQSSQSDLHRNFEFNIIGDGVLKHDLQQLIEKLNINDIVTLHGQKDQQEIIEILNNSHIFVSPSITSSDGEQDAPINTLKEAMAIGLPVISTLHGGIPELVEDGKSGFLVPERDADSIAQKLSYLIEHPQLWPEMGRAGRAYVEKHYDLHRLNDKLVNDYQRLLNAQKESLCGIQY